MNRIKELREAKGYTQEDLAQLAGVTGQAISFWETGKRNITTINAEKIAKALNVSPSFLVGWSDYDR